MSLSDLNQNFITILPLTFLAAWACALLLVDLFVPKERKWLTAALAAAGLIATLGLSIAQIGQPKTAFGGMIVVDGFAVFLNILFGISGLFGIALAYDYLKRMSIERGEYYVLLLFSITGMMLMSQASDLIIIFLALELLSIPLYVLAGFAQPRIESEEASLKYFLLGAFSTGFVVYGIALVYGATGSTALSGILAAVGKDAANLTLLTVGAGLVLVGLGFKVAAVPFHMWTPDVYQGAPTAVTAFMSVGAKAGGFAALLRVFVLAFPALSLRLVPVLWCVAALTMILGNVVAIAQSNIKRMLAYSSIAHAGYILMALAPFGDGKTAPVAVAAALFYLAAYAMTSFAAWAVVIALEQPCDQPLALDAHGRRVSDDCFYPGLAINDYAGLGRKEPLLAAAMAIAMLSFTGVPPTLGFLGKFYLFRAALEGGYVWLALIGVLTSLISAYYYLRIIVIMYMRDGDPLVHREPWLYITAGVSALVTLVFIIFAGPLFDWTAHAILRLM